MSDTPPTTIPDWYDVSFDPYLLEVGRMSAMWAEIEYAIDRLIWELLDVEANLGMCLTSQLIGPGPRLRALAALIDKRAASAELRREVLSLSKDIEALGAKRNRYAHDRIHIGTKTGIMRKTEITANKKLQYDTVELDKNTVRQLWIDIQSKSIRLADLREKLIMHVPLWNRERFKQSEPDSLAGELDQNSTA